jgi:lysophospholipase L1-like esterase
VTAVIFLLVGGLEALLMRIQLSGPERFDRDVIAQSGVKYLIIVEGINDIGRLSHPRAPADDVSVQDLETGLKQLVDRAHTHHIKVIGGTLTPYKGAGYYSEKGEAVREALNQWIRNSGAFDAVIDFDKVTGTRPIHSNSYPSMITVTIYIRAMPGMRRWAML